MLANLENSTVATGLENVSFHSDTKECISYWTIAVIAHASKVILNLLQARLPQYVVIHTVKVLVNEVEVDVVMEFPCFFYDPTDVGNLISGSSNFSKSSLNICKVLVQVLLKPGWRILSITLLVCEMSEIV